MEDKLAFLLSFDRRDGHCGKDSAGNGHLEEEAKPRFFCGLIVYSPAGSVRFPRPTTKLNGMLRPCFAEMSANFTTMAVASIEGQEKSKLSS